MDKRVFTTTLVCLGILVFWQTFVVPPPKPRTPSSAPTAAQSATSNGTAVNATPNSAAASTGGVGAANTASAMTNLAPKAQNPEQTSTYDGPLYVLEVTTHGGGIKRMLLKDYLEGGTVRRDEKHPVSLIGQVGDEPRPTALLSLNDSLFEFSEIVGDNEGIHLSGEQGGLKIAARWHPTDDPYVLAFTGEIENITGQALETRQTLTVGGVFNEQAAKKRSMFAPPPESLTPLYDVAGDVIRHSLGKQDSKEPSGAIKWAGIDRQYFLLAAAPKLPLATKVRFLETHEQGAPQYLDLGSLIEHAPRTIAPGQKVAFDYEVYAGPKTGAILKQAPAGFEDAIDYNVWGMPLGFLARPMLWVLNHAYQAVHSYGLAIIILTLVVKLIMLPVTQKAAMSMQVMKDLKPELDKIKERFPNDREKQGVETMRLYKERGANPFLSGCLPALLQMPVYLALWRSLWAAAELYQQPFLWLADLTARDPYYILPVLLGVTMFLQQRLTPPMGDPQQQKIMMFVMPPMMTVFMINLSSGLVFYIFVNNILTILQQTYISKKFAKPRAPVGQTA